MTSPYEPNHPSVPASPDPVEKEVNSRNVPSSSGQKTSFLEPAASGEGRHGAESTNCRLSRQKLLESYARLRSQGRLGSPVPTPFFVLAPVPQDARPLVETNDLSETPGITWGPQRDLVGHHDASLQSFGGGHRGRGSDYSGALKGRGTVRRLEEQHTSASIAAPNHAATKPFKTTTTGRGRGLRLPAPETTRRDMGTRLDPRGILNPTGGSTVSTPHVQAAPTDPGRGNISRSTIQGSALPPSTDSKRTLPSGPRPAQQQTEVLVWRRKDRPLDGVGDGSVVASTTQATPAPSSTTSQGFKFGRYPGGLVAPSVNSSTAGGQQQNTTYSGFMTPPTTFSKLERLPDRRGRQKVNGGDDPVTKGGTDEADPSTSVNDVHNDTLRCRWTRESSNQEGHSAAELPSAANDSSRKAWENNTSEKRLQTLSQVAEPVHVTSGKDLPSRPATMPSNASSADAAEPVAGNGSPQKSYPSASPDTGPSGGPFHDTHTAHALILQLLERLKQRPQDLHQMSAADLLTRLRSLGFTGRQRDGAGAVNEGPANERAKTSFHTATTEHDRGTSRSALEHLVSAVISAPIERPPQTDPLPPHGTTPSVASPLWDPHLLQSVHTAAQGWDASQAPPRIHASGFNMDSTAVHPMRGATSLHTDVTNRSAPPNNMGTFATPCTMTLPPKGFVDPAIQHASSHTSRVASSSSTDPMGFGRQQVPCPVDQPALSSLHPINAPSTLRSIRTSPADRNNALDTSAEQRRVSFFDSSERQTVGHPSLHPDDAQHQRVALLFQQLRERGLSAADILAVADSLAFQRSGVLNSAAPQDIRVAESDPSISSRSTVHPQSSDNCFTASFSRQLEARGNVLGRPPLGRVTQQPSPDMSHSLPSPFGLTSEPRLAPLASGPQRSTPLRSEYNSSFRPFSNTDLPPPAVDRANLHSSSHRVTPKEDWLDPTSTVCYPSIEDVHAARLLSRQPAQRQPMQQPNVGPGFPSGHSSLQPFGGAKATEWVPSSHDVSLPPEILSHVNTVASISSGQKATPSPCIVPSATRNNAPTSALGVDPAPLREGLHAGIPRRGASTGRCSASSSEVIMPQSLHEHVWEYRDPTGQIQGPFSTLQMAAWWEGNFFPSDLLMRYHSSLPWVPFHQLYPRHLYRRIPPFSSPRFPIVHSNGTVSHPFFTLSTEVHPPVKANLQHDVAPCSGIITHPSGPSPSDAQLTAAQGHPGTGQDIDTFSGATSAALMTHGLRSILGLTAKQQPTDPALKTHEASTVPSSREPLNDKAPVETTTHQKEVTSVGRTSDTKLPAVTRRSSPASLAQQTTSKDTAHPSAPVALPSSASSKDSQPPTQSRTSSSFEPHAFKSTAQEATTPKPKDLLEIMRGEDKSREQKPRKTAEKQDKPSWKVLPATTSSSPFDEEEFPDPSTLHHKASLKGSGNKSKNSSNSELPLSKGSKKSLHEFMKTKGQQQPSATRSVWNRVPTVSPAAAEQPHPMDQRCVEDALLETRVPVVSPTHQPEALQTEQPATMSVTEETRRTTGTAESAAEDASSTSWMTVSSSKKKLGGLGFLQDGKRKQNATPTPAPLEPPPKSTPTVRVPFEATTKRPGSEPQRSPLTVQEMNEIDKLLKHCNIELDLSMVEYLRTFKTADGVVDFLKDNLLHERSQLTFFATEFIAILQHPFTTVSYAKGGHGDHASNHAGGPSGTTSVTSKPNHNVNNTSVGWTKVASSNSRVASNPPQNNTSTRFTGKSSGTTDAGKKASHYPTNNTQANVNKAAQQPGGKGKEGKKASKGKKGKAAVDTSLSLAGTGAAR